MLFNLNQFVCDFEAIPDPNFFLSLTWHVTISIERIAWKHLFSVGLGKNFSSCGTFTIYFQNVLKQLLRLSLVFRKKKKNNNTLLSPIGITKASTLATLHRRAMSMKGFPQFWTLSEIDSQCSWCLVYTRSLQFESLVLWAKKAVKGKGAIQWLAVLP